MNDTAQVFHSDDVVFSYSRADAIEDGVLIDLEKNDAWKALCRQLYKYPVCFTQNLWAIIEKAVNNNRHLNDFNGVIWDVLYMSVNASTPLDESTRIFPVIITGAGQDQHFKLMVKVHPGDNFEPVITIGLEHDD